MSVTARTHSASRTGRYDNWSKLFLVVGLVALASGLLAAHAAPATGYELSIYAATPGGFWFGVVVAFLLGLMVALTPTARVLRGTALMLCGAAMLAVVALPFVRGYAFYGTADPLTHLGFARGLLDGSVSPFTMIYPGLHAVAAILSAVTGLPVARTILLAQVIFAASFLLFVPLAVAAITDRWIAIAVAAFAGIAFLPINHVGTHFRAHPFSQTVLLSGVVLYLALKYLTHERGSSHRAVTGTTGMLSLAAAAIVLYHPQQATNLLLVFLAICAVQVVVRRRDTSHVIATHRTLYVPTLVFALAYSLWVVPSSWFYGAISRHSGSLVAFVLGRSAAGSRVGSQTASLFEIGASIPEMFVKLFLPTALFALFAGVLLLGGASWIQDLRRRSTLRYLWVGVGLMVLFTAGYLVADVADMYFRHFGFVMLLTTVLGVVGLSGAASRVGGRTAPVWGRAFVALVVVVAVGLSAATVYQSPYIYKANQHVTEMQFDGYETAFESGQADVQIAGIRAPPERYHDAFAGPGEGARYSGKVAPENVTRLTERFDRTQYVVVTQLDRERELRAYQEIAFSQSDFDALDTQVGVDHVADNGEVDLYYVDESEAAT